MAEHLDEASPSEYTAILRRRLPWIVGILAISLGAGLAFLIVAPKSYESTATVLVSPSIGLDSGNSVAGRTSGDVNLDTEAQIVKSTPVAAAAAALLRSPGDPSDLISSLKVSVPPNTTVLSIGFAAPAAVAAREGAHAFAASYLELRKQQAEANVENRKASIEAEIALQNKALEKVSAEITSAPANSPDRAAAEAQRSVLINQIQGLNTQLLPLSTTEIAVGSILTDAQLPSSPASPDRLLVAGSALALGLVLALSVALLVDRADRRVRRAADVARTGLEVLVRGVGAARSLSLVLPSTREAALYAELRVSVFAQLPAARGTVLVAPVGGTDGGAVMAANLAASIARTGVSTLLVSTSPTSVAPRLLGAREDGPTLTDALKGVVPEVRASRVPTVPAVLLAGEGLPLVADQLQGSSMEKLLAQLRENFEMIIVEAPPVDTNPLGFGLAGVVDGVLVVVEERRTIRTVLLDASNRIRSTGTPTMGAVLLSPAPKRASSVQESPTQRINWWIADPSDLEAARPEVAARTQARSGAAKRST